MIARKREPALAILHKRYYRYLYTSAFNKLPNEQLVEELVQDVFINIWEKAPSLDQTENVKAYLFALDDLALMNMINFH